ncbi:unnamed protein product, partial [Didymodactylos carnosus]
VKSVHTDLKSLLSDLKDDVDAYLKHEKDGIFSEFGKENKTTDVSYSWWREFIRMLYRIDYPRSYFQKLILALRKYYEGKEEELKILDEFERTYTADRAIWWYTRNTFLYRLLNTALRQRNVEVVFLFGFYIKDMYDQMKSEHQNMKSKQTNDPVVTVYRGQQIAQVEMQEIEEGDPTTSLFGLEIFNDFHITINSFLSTSLNRSVAQTFLQSAPLLNGCVKALLTIKLDTRNLSLPFGDISHLSFFSNEHEILLMIGTILRVRKVIYDNSIQMYLVDIELSYDGALEEEQQQFEKTAAVKYCMNLAVNSFFTATTEQITAIFSQFNELFPYDNDLIEIIKCHCFGKHYELSQDHNEALANFEKALKTFERCSSDIMTKMNADIIKIHEDMARVYQQYIDDNTLANKHYEIILNFYISSIQKTINTKEKLQIIQKILQVYDKKIELSQNGNERRENILNAIEYQKLLVNGKEKDNSVEYKDIAADYQHLADLQKSISDLEEAARNYERSAEIYITQEQPDYHYITGMYKSICELYIDEKEDYTAALPYKAKELEFWKKEKIVNPTDTTDDPSYVAICNQEIADIYIKLHQFQRATEHLLVAKQIYEN